MRAAVAKPQRPQGQLAKVEAGHYRPIVDPGAQAAAIADVIRPLIAEKLAEVRAPLPRLSDRDQLIMKACADVGDAVDRYEAARQTPGERAAYQNLGRATSYLSYLRASKEVDLGSR